MAAKLSNPDIGKLFVALQQSGPRGCELANVLDQRSTMVRFAPIKGGFTLNIVNTVFLEPLPQNANKDQFDFWVSLLAHEACHVEQRFIVDSVEQEVRAYLAQCQVAGELGLSGNSFVQRLGQACENVDFTQRAQLEAARQAIDNLFGDQPATMLYKALPLVQPSGFGAVVAAFVEIRALVRTLYKKS